jgi:Xaa-Pro aminopeptidase
MSIEKIPQRGFPVAEFETRLARAQSAMQEQGLDLLFLTQEAEVRYFSGFHSQFWESPTRPWFLLVPKSGKPVAVIPEIGAAGMASTWIEDIRTWAAPSPEDDGVTLLGATIKDLVGARAVLGVPLGHESLLRMPAQDYKNLLDLLPNIEIRDAAPLIHRLRFVKSPAEIEKISYICNLTSAAFEALPDIMSAGMSEREICAKFRMDLLARGADHSPYIISGSGHGGYDNIIMGPTDHILNDGDIMIIDTGTVFDGYFCDFDRNWAFGCLDDQAKRAHEVIHQATEIGFQTAQVGATTSDVFHAMWRHLEAGGALGNDVGRMGHSLGMQLTEGPSVHPDDHSLLEAGVVLTLEPGMSFAKGKQLVHEENILITEDGPKWLTRRADFAMKIIT